MRISKRSFISISAAFVLTATLSAAIVTKAQALTPPEAYIQTVAKELVSEVNRGGSVSRYKSLLNRYADMPRIANFSLGKYRKSISNSQRSQYVRLMSDHIAKIFKQNTNAFKGASLKVLNSKKGRSNQFLVRSKLTLPTGSATQVNWKVAQKGSRFRIYDVSFGGVWMGSNRRATFTSVLKKNNGDINALLAFLKK